MPRCGIRKRTENNFPVPSMPGDVFISCEYQGWENFSSREGFPPSPEFFSVGSG